MLMTMILWSAAVAASPPTILPPETLAAYRAAAPRVGAPKIDAILRDDATFWYDSDAMIPSYQDTVGDGSSLPIGARANSAGKAIIVPEGQKFFADDGGAWAFPFGHTAGTDSADNVAVAHFLRLPTVNGQLLPVVYSLVDDAAWQGIGLHRWTWQFPEGSVVGELIFVKDAAGERYPAEVRTRTRQGGSWTSNVFRPFPTAAALRAAVQRLRPAWQGSATLTRLVEALGDATTLQPSSAASPGFNAAVTLSGYLDVVPDFGDDALVKELLTSTTFVSAYGTAWKKNGDKAAYAASTEAAFSIVPRHYFAGLIEVSDESCTRCHAQADTMLNDFEPATILYGDLWGMDEIFSFHPWDQTRYDIFNNDNRQVRLEFQAGLVQPYSPVLHPPQFYPPPRG